MIEWFKWLFFGASESEHRRRSEEQKLVASLNEKLAKNAEQVRDKPIHDLQRLRRLMRFHGVGIYLVMEQDEHRSEYVADTDRRIRYISGFTGSSAFVSIGMQWAELATDSRYYIIASKQLSPAWTLRKLGKPGVQNWDDAVVETAIREGVEIGIDPKFINATLAETINSKLQRAGRALKPIDTNLIDEIWVDKPALPAAKIVTQPFQYSGKLASEKLRECRESMHEYKVKSLIVYSLEEIAWLLNLRGADVPYVPVFKSFLIISESIVTLYVDNTKLSLNLSHHEGVKVLVKDYDLFFEELPKAAAPIWVPNEGSWLIYKKATTHSPREKLLTDISPVNTLRAIKNTAEIEGIRQSQLKCSLSIVRYFAWLNSHIDDGINEFEGAEVLRRIREKLPDFRGNSFETISAAGPNASAPHYAPTSESSAPITRDNVYLLDSGSQFLQGSTDITRTVHYGVPTKEHRRAYTLVLKGHLAVATCVFPRGTSGWKLDILARQFLWQESMDYGHGTGHGIGSYLNIHELPLGIGMTNGPESVLRPGHFVSDEPGFYKDGEFGVRLESDILVIPHSTDSSGKEYLTFEIMTLVPYELKLIDRSLLTEKEVKFINSYHSKCYENLRPYLSGEDELSWLKRTTSPL